MTVIMRASMAATLALALISVSAFSQLSEMSVVFEDGLHVLNEGQGVGLNDITPATYELFQWPWGTIPLRCYRAAVDDDLCDPYDMEAYDALFVDCTESWKLCRCKDSPMTAKNIADGMAKVSVSSRQWTRFWSSYNGTLSAGNGGNDVTIFGDASDITSIFFHEVAHSLDSWAMGEEYQGSASSDRPLWRDIIANDTCVPDEYAKRSYHESYAQVYVMMAYDARVRNIYNYNVQCMANQVEKGRQMLKSLVRYSPKDACTRRWSERDSPRVCMGHRARMLSRCNGVPYADGRERELHEETKYPATAAGNDDGTPKHYQVSPIAAQVDDVAEKGSIKIEENRAKNPAMQRALEERDAQRWVDTLSRAGRRQE